MILKFLKYFTWGLAGFLIQSHWSGCPADFFVLTLGFAFPLLGLGPTLILALGLSLFYGAHSVSPWAAWWVPAGLSLLPLRYWKAYLNWPRPLQRGVTMTLLLAGPWAWSAAWGGGSAALWDFFRTWAGTLVFGMALIPFLHFSWKALLQRLPRPRKKMGELPLYWKNVGAPRGHRGRRRPFGLEGV